MASRPSIPSGQQRSAADVSQPFVARCSVHPSHHNKTPRDRFSAIEAAGRWENRDLTALDLAEVITAGHSWVGCHLSEGRRDQDHAGTCNLLVLDIDGDLTLEAFWANPLVRRHCLFTATSCSHSDAEHRFRAVFRCDEHDDPDLHRALYHQWLERLGLRLKDNSGEKSERHWFGNAAALLEFGEGEPIPWEVTENAREALAAQRQALTQRRTASQSGGGDELELDLQRAVICLEQLLRPSADGDFSGGYWVSMLNAAAATGDERIEQAFLQWHHRGHHSKTQGNIKRRLARAGTRMTPGQGAGAILAAAKEQHGAQWWKLLPPELQYGGGGGVITPTSLMRSRAISDTKGPSFEAPDLVPSMQELQRLSAAAQPISLMASRGHNDTNSNHHSSANEPLSESLQIELLLAQLYLVETEDKQLTAEGDVQLTPQKARYLKDQLESQLQNFPVFRSNPQRIRTRLLEIFCDRNGIVQRNEAEREAEKLLSEADHSDEYLLENLMIRGASYLLYSAAGIGKTTLALLLSRAVLGTPGHDNLLGFKATPSEPFSQSRVLYIASDGGLFAKGDINRYLKQMNQQDEEWVDYMLCYSAHRSNSAAAWRMNLRGLHQLVQELDRQQAAGTPIRMLVIDSLKACMPDGLLIGDQAVTRYLEVIEGICGPRNVTTVYLNHQSKESDQPQGIAGLTEMVHGYFRIRKEENQHYFCITKVRDGKGARREIPYKVTLSGQLIACDAPDSIDHNSPESQIITAFANHYTRHLKTTGHLDPDDPMCVYRGVQRSDVLLLLRQQGFSNPALRSARTIDRILGSLTKSGDLQKLEYGRYAIGHARRDNPIQQKQIDLREADREEPDLDGPDVIPGWD